MKQINMYLICFLLTLWGAVLLISNAKDLIVLPGLLLASILLMVIPSIIVALNYNFNNFGRFQSLSLVFFPLFIIIYLISIKVGFPVGFQDTHSHIMQYQNLFGEQGNIIFANVQTISYNFVGLYIIFHFLVEMTNLDIISLVLLIPPFFNLITVLIIYTIVNKLHYHNIALIAALLFGWENQVIIFSHEMRTQTVGILLLFVLLSLFVINQNSSKKSSTSMRIALILTVFSIVTTSFVSILYTSIILLIIMITAYLLPILFKWPKQSICITWRLYGLFLIFFISYLFYVSAGFDHITSTIINLLNGAMDTGAVITYSGPPIYGYFVTNVNRILWVTFLFSSGSYLIDIIKNKNVESGVFYTGFGFLLFLWAFNFIMKPLSPSRIYIVGFFIIATVVSFGLFKMQSSQTCSKKRYKQFANSAFAFIIIILFVISSVVQFPNYIIGETNPIRGEEPIDTVPYWDSDLPQYAVGSFLSSSSENESIYLHIFIRNYYLLQTSKVNSLSYKESTSLKETLATANQGNLVVLQDKFKGQIYTHRNLLPKSEEYDLFQKVYSNRDYIVYSL